MIHACLQWLILSTFFAMTGAHAAWLHLCERNADDAHGAAAQARSPDGTQHDVHVDDTPARPGCKSLALPVPADAVEAVRPLPASVASNVGDTIVVQGNEQDGGFHITSVDAGAARAPRARPSAPLRANLLPGVRLQVFGSEERAQATFKDGRLELQCNDGAKPAGVVLHVPWRLPLAGLRLQVHARGKGSFEFLMADAIAETGSAARSVGTLNAVDNGSLASFPLPAQRFDRRQWRSLTIACPDTKTQLHVESLQLHPQAVATHARSMWIWQAGSWQRQPNDVLSLAAKYGASQLFISIPVAGGRVSAPGRLSAFIGLATRRGVKVWSVDGDPRMVLPSEYKAAAARASAYLAFNASHPETPIAGLQFDVEPYLLPDHDPASPNWEETYLGLARDLRRAAGSLPLEFVVPFWWAEKETLLDRLAEHANSLCVMDYRTDRAEIASFAAPFLDWGNRHRKRVRIALESGPVGIEVQRRYTKAGEGELWLATTESMPILLLLNRPFPNPAGPSYKLSGSRVFDGSATSFLGDSARLLSLLPALESDFAAWRSFAGIALHEVK